MDPLAPPDTHTKKRNELNFLKTDLKKKVLQITKTSQSLYKCEMFIF